jgi:lysyl-tRNA synthetase class 2
VITASFVSKFWHNLVEHDEQGLFLVLAGFILSFAFIRMSTRMMRSPRFQWWPGSIVSDSGVHLHHLVFGIVTMMAAGTLGFVALGHSPYVEICAFAFGVGAGLTIDEFALWVYLDDVYWAQEGRSSIDATVIAAAGMLLLLLGFTPFSFDTGSPAQVVGSLLGALLVFATVAVCFAKQRLMHGAIGFFLLPIAIYGAIRIGKPNSPWARRRYGDRRPKRQAKSIDRFPPGRRTERFKDAFRDIVGGKPSEGVTAARDEAIAATREATAEVRHRAERVTHRGEDFHR